jgi:hypothetical protein
MSIISSITDNVTLTSSNSAINFNSASGNINIKTAYAVNPDTSNNINIGNISSQNGIRNINIGNLTAQGLTGTGNINIGNGSSNSGITTNYNVVLGTLSLGASLSGQANICVGYRVANTGAINSANNVMIGTYAADSSIITGEGNIFLGNNSGSNTSNILDNNTLIGSNTKLSPNLSNATAIGANTTVYASNTIQLGSNSETVGISGSLKSGANTITATQLGYLSGISGGIIDISTNQTISSTKTFTGGITASTAQTINFGSNAPTMSGANISSGTIGQTQINKGYVDLSNNQTIDGIKTFSTAPTMSGAGISSGTIGQTQIYKGYVDLSNNQTIDGIKTFSTAPTMSGAGISATSIPNTALQTSVCLLNNETNIFTGLNQIRGEYVHSSYTVTPNATLTIQTPIYEIYPLSPSGNMTITLPNASLSLIGVRIQFRRVVTNNTNTIKSNSSNIYPNNSMTAGDIIMAANVYTAVIYCTYVTTTTYGWFLA